MAFQQSVLELEKVKLTWSFILFLDFLRLQVRLEKIYKRPKLKHLKQILFEMLIKKYGSLYGTY